MAADDDADFRRSLSAAQREINAEEKDAQVLVRRLLINWAVRWVIGFALVGVIFYSTPNSAWLWWAAIVVAGISLVYILTLAVLTRRKLETTRARLSAADEFAKCLEEAARKPR